MRRVRREAQHRLAVAEKAKDAAERELAGQDAALQALRGRVLGLAEQAAKLENELRRVSAAATRAEAEVPEAKARRADAVEQAQAAAVAVDRARTALDEL